MTGTPWGRRVHAAARERTGASTRLDLAICVFEISRPTFESPHERKNNQSEKSTQQRHPQAAQSDGYPDGRRHPNAGSRRQPLYITLFIQLEDGASPEETNAGNNALNDT